MVTSGTVIVGTRVLVHEATKSITQTHLLGPKTKTETKHVSIDGAKNILLVGIDPRPDQKPTDPIRADSIIIMHIPANHDQAYLVSIPRDTYVQIPAYNNGKSNFRGGSNKINAAFANGGDGLTGTSARQHGFELLAETIKSLYGITFDAGAIVDFAGFQQVVNVLGGVTMNVDEKTTSIHIGFTKSGKEAMPYRLDKRLQLHAVYGVKPVVYKPGVQHLAPWQALDYVRQRELLSDGDYGRQRHQQQFLKAIFQEILSGGVLTNPGKLKSVLNTVGKAMTVDPGGVGLEDWIFAMKGIGGDDMMTMKTNNGNFYSTSVAGIGSVEHLTDTSKEMLADVRNDSMSTFVRLHPDWVSN
jgi:LCP family protein required for cell wall assembly